MVEFDFDADLRSEVKARLISEGYDVPADEDPDAVVRWWFTTRARSIPRQKRTVVRSKRLQTGRDLLEEERDSLRRIERFAREGKNLNHFLSRKRLDADFNDALFVSWKILHFHLGRPSGGNVASTSRLLFARVEPTKMHLIDVGDHKDFSRQELLKIVEENWPELNSRGHLRGVVGLKHEVTDEEIAKLRAAGINPISMVGGRVIAPIGGGLATDKSSVNATRDWIGLKQQFRDIERQIREEPTRLAGLLGMRPGELPSNLRFKLHLVGDAISVRELFTGKTIANWPIERTA